MVDFVFSTYILCGDCIGGGEGGREGEREGGIQYNPLDQPWLPAGWWLSDWWLTNNRNIAELTTQPTSSASKASHIWIALTELSTHSSQQLAYLTSSSQTTNKW